MSHIKTKFKLKVKVNALQIGVSHRRYLVKKAEKLSLRTEFSRRVDFWNFEMVLVGDRKHLWEIIREISRPRFLVVINKVDFSFEDF
jgi:hypothetical protein